MVSKDLNKSVVESINLQLYLPCHSFHRAQVLQHSRDGFLLLFVVLTCPIPQQLQFSVSGTVNHTSINVMCYIIELFSAFTVTNGKRSRKPDALRHSSTSGPRYYIIAWVIKCTSSSFAALKEHERNNLKNNIKEKYLQGRLFADSFCRGMKAAAKDNSMKFNFSYLLFWPCFCEVNHYIGNDEIKKVMTCKGFKTFFKTFTLQTLRIRVTKRFYTLFLGTFITLCH